MMPDYFFIYFPFYLFIHGSLFCTPLNLAVAGKNKRMRECSRCRKWSVDRPGIYTRVGVCVGGGGGAGSLSSLFRPSLNLYFTLSNIYFSRSASHTGKVNPNGLLIILGRNDSVPPCN